MTTMAEPEWDQATRDIVLGLDDVELCPCCGRPSSICQDPDRVDDWEVPPPYRCFATTAVRDRQKAFNEHDNPHLDALVWRVLLKDQEG